MNRVEVHIRRRTEVRRVCQQSEHTQAEARIVMTGRPSAPSRPHGSAEPSAIVRHHLPPQAIPRRRGVSGQSDCEGRDNA